jgi:hypothetical protein
VDNEIELADLIWQLRHDLSRAMWAGENSDLRFEAGPVQLELTVAVERQATPNAKVRLLVLDASAGVKRASIVTQRISLTLHPRTAADLSKPPIVRGQSRPHER